MRRDTKIPIPLAGVYLLVIVLLAAGCSGFSLAGDSKPPQSVNNPPIYPGARNMVDKVEPTGQPDPDRRITFDTDDSVDKVLDYYTTLLNKESWSARTRDLPNGSLYYRWGGGPIYSFTVNAEKLAQGTTRVELYIRTMRRE